MIIAQLMSHREYHLLVPPMFPKQIMVSRSSPEMTHSLKANHETNPTIHFISRNDITWKLIDAKIAQIWGTRRPIHLQKWPNLVDNGGPMWEF